MLGCCTHAHTKELSIGIWWAALFTRLVAYNGVRLMRVNGLPYEIICCSASIINKLVCDGIWSTIPSAEVLLNRRRKPGDEGRRKRARRGTRRFQQNVWTGWNAMKATMIISKKTDKSEQIHWNAFFSNAITTESGQSDCFSEKMSQNGQRKGRKVSKNYRKIGKKKFEQKKWKKYAKIGKIRAKPEKMMKKPHAMRK